MNRLKVKMLVTWLIIGVKVDMEIVFRLLLLGESVSAKIEVEMIVRLLGI